MLITQVVGRDAEGWRLYLLEAVLGHLADRFDIELIVPDESEALKALRRTRAKLTVLPLSDDDENMIRNIYILSRHFRKSGTGIVHSHGSVSASLSSFLASRGDIVAIKDYYASCALGRVISALSPRARLSLTLSYSPSDRDILTRAGVRDSSIVPVPWGIELPRRDKSACVGGDVPVIVASCCNREECALFLSAAALIVRKHSPLLYIEIPSSIEPYARHLSCALGIGRSLHTFVTGSIPSECSASALCFVLPTLSPTSIPHEAARYMSLGVPAVVPDTPRCLDLVRCGHTGEVFRFGDSHSLSAALFRMLELRGRGDALSALARERAESFCPIERTAECLAELYESLAPAP